MSVKNRFLAGFFSGHCSISELIFQRFGLPNRGFRTESIAKTDLSWKSFLMSFGIVCWQPWGQFSDFFSLGTSFKMRGFFLAQNLFMGRKMERVCAL